MQCGRGRLRTAINRDESQFVLRLLRLFVAHSFLIVSAFICAIRGFNCIVQAQRTETELTADYAEKRG